jgi:AsmA protein
MSKLLKIFGTLLLLLVVVAALVPFLVHPDDFKDDVESAFAAATGRELVIAGHLRISLLPRPVLEATDVSVLGGFGNRRPALAQIDRVCLYPRLLPLLSGHLELRLVRLEGLHLQLARDEEGHANWKVAAVSPRRSQSASSAPLWTLQWRTPVPGPFDVLAAEARPASGGLVIGGIEILNARVTWDDRSSDRRLEIDDLEAFAGPVAPGEPVAFRLKGSLHNPGGESTARLQAEGSLVIGDDRLRPRVDPLTVELQGLGPKRELAADLTLHTGLEADFDARRFLAESLVLDIRASGEALSDRSIKAEAKARLELDLRAERLDVRDLSIRSGALSAKGTVLGQGLMSTPLFTGDLMIEELDLRAWLGQQGLPLPETADAETFRHVSLNTSWRLEGDRLGAKDLALTIDQTRLTGAVERIAVSPPRYRFDLGADRLDLNRYMPGSKRIQAMAATKLPRQESKDNPVILSEQQPAPQLPSRRGTKTTAPVHVLALPRIPLSERTISNLDLEGRLRVGELEVARLRFSDADVGIKAKDGHLDIEDRIQRFYEGRLDGNLGLDLRGAQPRVTFTQDADGIRTGRLLADLTGEQRFTGRGKITAHLTATGRSENALRRSLAGTLAIDIPQGQVKGINLERLAREAEARLRGKHPPSDLPTSTDFKDLHATAQVQGGVLHNQDLVAHTDYLRITGSGTLDLAEERFDYRFEPIFVKPPKGRGIKELEGAPIPVYLTGPFSHPRWKVDLRNALRAAAKNQLGEQGSDLFQALEKRTGIKGLEQGLKNLLGQ